MLGIGWLSVHITLKMSTQIFISCQFMSILRQKDLKNYSYFMIIIHVKNGSQHYELQDLSYSKCSYGKNRTIVTTAKWYHKYGWFVNFWKNSCCISGIRNGHQVTNWEFHIHNIIIHYTMMYNISSKERHQWHEHLTIEYIISLEPVYVRFTTIREISLRLKISTINWTIIYILQDVCHQNRFQMTHW